MKTGSDAEASIIAILRQAEGAMPVAKLCREHGMMPLPDQGLPANHQRECDVLQMTGKTWRYAFPVNALHSPAGSPLAVRIGP